MDSKISLDNITGYLSRNANRFPNKPAMLHPEKISFKELDEEVNRYAAGLIFFGVKKGTHTILLVSPGLEFFVLCFALFRIGAVPIMIDPGMGRKAMVKALAGSGAQAFIGVSRAHILRFLYPGSFKSISIWINTGQFWIPGSKTSGSLRKNVNLHTDKVKMKADDKAAIFFTSGSTGPPKGVVYSAGMLDAMVRMMEEHFRYGPEDIDLCTFPLLGLFVTCLGSSLVIADMNPLKPAKLDPRLIIKNLNDHQCTQMFGSPMILKKLIEYSKSEKVELSSLRRIISAGAPVPIEVQREFLQLAVKKAVIHTPYGATEALPVTDITFSVSSQYDDGEVSYDKGICIGYPLPGLDVRIISIIDDSIEALTKEISLPVGEVGEIVVRGSHITQEYNNDFMANLMSKMYEKPDKGLWHRMGDLGRVDQKGCIWFYGRKNHRVQTRSGTMYTIPTEARFNRHSQVFRSALVGVRLPGKEFEIPVIVLQPEADIKKRAYIEIIKDLTEIASEHESTREIVHFLINVDFPVDPRHNAKIFREKLAIWAERRIK